MTDAEPRPSLDVTTNARRTRQLLHLAWPAVLSYILNNTYRINDQFWIQGLGEKAQAAVGATFFVQVLNFSVVFLAVGGTLALVSRAVGARADERRDSLIRSALGLGLGIGAALTVGVLPFVGPIVHTLGLEGEAAVLAERYLRSLYPFMSGMALLPVVDSIFIARGNTRVPMILQGCSVALNYLLNPLLIYGRHAAEHSSAPGTRLVAWIAGLLDLEGHGMTGAGVATGISRTTVVLAGLAILRLHYGTGFFPRRTSTDERELHPVLAIVRISFPSSASIAVYACAYLLLLRFVLTPLGDEVTAALGIGFQVFEGLAFPCYLGVSIAASSLVGRELGARNRAGVLEVVGSARLLGRLAGIAFALAFWFLGPHVVHAFTRDAGVAEQTIVYVRTLAFSQYWVAVETVNEKVLLGAGQTRPILWISSLGNLLRVPLGRFLALGVVGLGGAGIWWAINVSTALKAWLFWRRVQSGGWLDDAFAEAGPGGSAAPRRSA